MLCHMEKPTTLVASSIQRIRRFRAHKEWKINRLAKEAGLRESSIRNIDDPTWNPESRTLASLEAVIPATFKGDGTDVPEAEPQKGEAA